MLFFPSSTSRLMFHSSYVFIPEGKRLALFLSPCATQQQVTAAQATAQLPLEAICGAAGLVQPRKSPMTQCFPALTQRVPHCSTCSFIWTRHVLTASKMALAAVSHKDSSVSFLDKHCSKQLGVTLKHFCQRFFQILILASNCPFFPRGRYAEEAQKIKQAVWYTKKLQLITVTEPNKLILRKYNSVDISQFPEHSLNTLLIQLHTKIRALPPTSPPTPLQTCLFFFETSVVPIPCSVMFPPKTCPGSDPGITGDQSVSTSPHAAPCSVGLTCRISWPLQQKRDRGTRATSCNKTLYKYCCNSPPIPQSKVWGTLSTYWV